MFIRSLPVVVVTLALSLPAQQKPGARLPQSPAAEESGEEAGDGKPVDAGTDKPGFDERHVDMTPRGKCRFEVTVHPERLLPGQSGTIKVLMILQGDAVMEAPATLALTTPAPTPAMQVGPMTLQPPQPAGVAAAYGNRPVYDNYALAEVPVTMGARAQIGTKQSTTLQANFQLHEGATGKLLGNYVQRLTVFCEVGQTADPAVRMPAPSAAGEPEAAAPSGATAEPESGLPAAAQGGAAAIETAPVREPEPEPARVEPARGAGGDAVPDLRPGAEGGDNTMFLVAGGLIGILLIVVLLARKRS